MPVCPIYDLVIKDCDLVIATHGRSFWILDDLAPLHQAGSDLSARGAHLFAPAPKARMREYGRLGEWYDQPSNRVNYGRIGTSVAALEYREDSDLPQFLNAGRNPRPGIVFCYHLAEAGDEPVVLNIRAADGELIRSYSSAAERDGFSAATGLNRFHWNLRYPGAMDVDESLASWERPDGPMVVPGEYIAELVVVGESCQQTFEVLADPRLETTAEAFAAQRNMLLGIRDRLSQNNELINKLMALKGQVEGWATRCNDEALLAAGAAISAHVDELLPKLINTGISESQLYPSGLHEKLNALFGSVDSADYAPPQQAREVFAQLSAELDGHVDAVKNVLGEKVAAFNAVISELGLGACGFVVIGWDEARALITFNPYPRCPLGPPPHGGK